MDLFMMYVGCNSFILGLNWDYTDDLIAHEVLLLYSYFWDDIMWGGHFIGGGHFIVSGLTIKVASKHVKSVAVYLSKYWSW